MTAPALTLDASQAAAVDLITVAPFAVLTGGPGTGKTTTLIAALDRLEAAGERVALAAPTGKASRRMREVTGRPATTVHRLLDFGPIEGGKMAFRRNADAPIEADVVFIDEASMLDAKLASAVTDAVRGSTRLVLVGDADQLPSVGPGRVFGDLIASEVVPVARLTTLHRAAAESWVCTQAPEILAGRSPDLRTRRDFLFEERDGREQATEALITTVFRTLPSRKVAALDVQVLIPQRVGPCGTVAVNARLQELLNPPRETDAEPWKAGEGVVLRMRDRVIMNRNDYELGVMNGETGVVAVIHPEPTQCDACDGMGILVEAASAKCPTCNGKGRRPPALVVKFPDDAGSERLVRYERGDVHALDLAYALTIHKSQGSQWPWVVVFVHSTHTHMLSRPLLYTGITRAQVGVVIVGDKAGIARGAKNAGATVRNTALRDRLRAALSRPVPGGTDAPALPASPEIDAPPDPDDADLGPDL